jgi:phosphate transport system protein
MYIRHLQRELDGLKRRLLLLCAKVEKDVSLAVRAVEERDADLADDVIADDMRIDMTEVDIEEECLKILALHQPVANDLRVIIGILKINSDLERIGDLSVNIAEEARFIAAHGLPPRQFDFAVMADEVKAMLRGSVDALVELNVEKAQWVRMADDRVDEMNSRTYDTVVELARAGKHDPVLLLAILSVSRQLERIADHATNIAEDTVYMISGSIVRHGVKGSPQSRAGSAKEDVQHAAETDNSGC